MTEYPDLATAAKQIERGFLGSFNAPSLDNAENWTVDRHDIIQNDEKELIVKRRYSLRPIYLTRYR